MKKSEQINEIAAALSKAQAQMENAIKGSTNPHLKNRYADYTAMLEVIREPFKANGLSFVQEAMTNDKTVAVSTLIMHSSGQWIEFEPLSMPIEKQNAQGVGSAVTYGKRYALGAAIGIGSAEDDDGEKACRTESRPDVIISKEQLIELNTFFDKLSTERQNDFNRLLEKELQIKGLGYVLAKDFIRIKNTLMAAVNNAHS